MTPTAERDWFEVLPDGLVVVLEPDQSGGWSTTSGAWLHIGGDGIVTAFTGKVDAGQDNRTGLSIILAEVDRRPARRRPARHGRHRPVPPRRRDVRQPLDAGCRARAAGPRAGGTRRARRSGECSGGVAGAGIGDARRGTAASRRRCRGMPTADGGERRRDRSSGTPPGVPRLTGRSIVTGTKRYPSDVVLPGMRHGQVLRPPAVGATLRSVDLGDVAGEDVTVVRDGSFVGVVAATDGAGTASRSPARRPSGICPTSPARPISSRTSAPTRSRTKAGRAASTGRAATSIGRSRRAQVRVEATYRTAFIAHVPHGDARRRRGVDG